MMNETKKLDEGNLTNADNHRVNIWEQNWWRMIKEFILPFQNSTLIVGLMNVWLIKIIDQSKLWFGGNLFWIINSVD